jgi:acetyltransferase
MEKLSTRVAHERLIRKCFVDYDREMALVADRVLPGSTQHEIQAVGRLTKSRAGRDAEVALLVSDRCQREGLGGELLRRLIQVGRDEKIREIVANVLPENVGMWTLAKRFGFEIRKTDDPSVVVATIRL